MMRSLWTAATGMKTQQLTVDTIANNLANANTVGYKKERIEFKSLLYETLRTAGDISTGGEPVNLQVGHGVRAAGSVKTFTQGNLERTDAPLDFSLEGNGFFAIQMPNGDVNYTKDGSFKMAMKDGQVILTNVSGYPVLDSTNQIFTFPDGVLAEKVLVDEEGKFSYVNPDGVQEDLGLQLQVVQFQNEIGLKTKGGGMFETTIASGEALPETENVFLEKSVVMQGSLESSNVQAVEEMVKMIIAQRAYELSSKAIQTSDDMLGLANNLKR